METLLALPPGWGGGTRVGLEGSGQERGAPRAESGLRPRGKPQGFPKGPGNPRAVISSFLSLFGWRRQQHAAARLGISEGEGCETRIRPRMEQLRCLLNPACAAVASRACFSFSRQGCDRRNKGKTLILQNPPLFPARAAGVCPCPRGRRGRTRPRGLPGGRSAAAGAAKNTRASSRRCCSRNQPCKRDRN